MPKFFKTDLDKTREVGERIQKAFANYWTPKVGKNEIRILPPWSKEGLAFKELVVHFSVGPDKRTVGCLRKFGKKCFICEMVDKLKSEEDTESKELAKRMTRKNRYMWNILDLRDLKSGVQVLSCGVRLFEGVWVYFADEDWGDIVHPDKGYNLVVTRVGSGLNTKYSVLARRKPEKMPMLLDTSSPLDSLYDLDAVFPISSYEEQKQIFEGFVESALEEEEEAEEREVVEKEEVEEVGEENAIESVPVKGKVEKPVGKVLDKPKDKPCFGKEFDAGEEKCMDCPKIRDCMRVSAGKKTDAESVEEELRR